nr:origin recognition complex subunit 4 [Hymenolepis microstoma]
MESIITFLRGRLLSSSHEIQYFQEELSRVEHTIRDTVINGISNSMLLIGRRGSGKTHLLRSVLEKLKQDPVVEENLIEIHINGLVHTDDRIALHSITKQLQRSCSGLSVKPDLLKLVDDENSDEGTDPVIAEIRMQSFAKHLRWLLSCLRSSGGFSKALLVVLEEFDLFAAHRNQALLYNLLDVSCHADGAPLCIIGLTCRLDVMEMLEKRVKSRFSHRQLHVIPVTAPRLTDSSMAAATLVPMDDDVSDNERDDGPVSPFQRYCLLAANLLLITGDQLCQITATLPSSERRKVTKEVTEWNAHVEEFFQDEMVRDCLRQTWEVSTCVRKLKNVIALLIPRLDESRTRLTAQDFISVLSMLRQDAKTSLLPSLSILELILITVMVKLHDIHDGQALNFEIVFNEYSRFCKSRCPNYLYEKRVVSKAMDNLMQLELVVCGRDAIASVSANPCVRARGGPKRFNVAATVNLPGQLKRFQPIACFVSTPLLVACLDAYSGCPIELSQWAHSRTL